jgi:hypothetical protein
LAGHESFENSGDAVGSDSLSYSAFFNVLHVEFSVRSQVSHLELIPLLSTSLGLEELVTRPVLINSGNTVNEITGRVIVLSHSKVLSAELVEDFLMLFGKSFRGQLPNHNVFFKSNRTVVFASLPSFLQLSEVIIETVLQYLLGDWAFVRLFFGMVASRFIFVSELAFASLHGFNLVSEVVV